MDGWASRGKKDGLSQLKKIAAQELRFGDVHEFLGIIVLFAGLYQSSELWGPLCRMIVPPACEEGPP